MKQTITIDKDEYDEMKKGHDFLLFLQQCLFSDLADLEASDWKGYFRALDLYGRLTKAMKDEE